jgi:hypothetical protein
MKKVLYILLFSVIASSAFAQKSLTSIQYSIGFGAGDLHDFISPASFRGVTFDYVKLLENGFGVGIETGWNAFYEKKSFATYSFRNFDYSGKQYRYSNHFPLLATIGYYHNPEGMITPFLSLGVGTMYSLRNTDMGTYTFKQDAWQFVMRPEIGVLHKLSGGASVYLSSKYYYGFKSGDLPYQSYFTINFGIVFNN